MLIRVKSPSAAAIALLIRFIEEQSSKPLSPKEAFESLNIILSEDISLDWENFNPRNQLADISLIEIETSGLQGEIILSDFEVGDKNGIH